MSRLILVMLLLYNENESHLFCANLSLDTMLFTQVVYNNSFLDPIGQDDLAVLRHALPCLDAPLYRSEQTYGKHVNHFFEH